MTQPIDTVRAATAMMRTHFPPSRLVSSEQLSRSIGARVCLKLETELPTGSFKVRGALTAITRAAASDAVREVVTSSTGNHGAATAFAAKEFGIPAIVFLPCAPNPTKYARIASLGARIIEVGGQDLVAAREAAEAYANAPGVLHLEDATDSGVAIGTGTIGLEILDQCVDVDTVVIPVGDSALIRGVACVVKQLAPAARVIGVQAERAPAYYLSWKAGHVVTTDDCPTIADGIATRIPNAENVRAVRDLVDDIVLVSDNEIVGAIRHLALDEQIVAEPAGAAAVAALLYRRAWMGSSVVALVTGANIAPDLFRSAMCGDPSDLARE